MAYQGHRGSDNMTWRQYVLGLAQQAGWPEMAIGGGLIGGPKGDPWTLFCDHGNVLALQEAEARLEVLANQ